MLLHHLIIIHHSHYFFFLCVTNYCVVKHLLPRETVVELDKHIIGQTDAKRAVAVALSMYYIDDNHSPHFKFHCHQTPCPACFCLDIENELESVGIFPPLILTSFIHINLI